MSDNNVHIVPASDLSNVISHHSWYINDYVGTVSSSYENIYPISSNFPLNPISNLITFQIPTGSYAIALKESHLEMNTVLTYHFKPSSNANFVIAANAAVIPNIIQPFNFTVSNAIPNVLSSTAFIPVQTAWAINGCFF